MGNDHLAAVGVSDVAARLLSDTLLRPGADEAVTPDTPGARELIDLGVAMLDGSTGHVIAAGPRRAFGALVAQQRRLLAGEEQKLLSILDTADVLQARYEDVQSLGEPTALYEILRGMKAVGPAMEHAISMSRRRIRTLTVAPTNNRHLTVNDMDVAALRRGVRYQCIYSPGYFDFPGAADVTRQLADLGEEQRARAGLPSVMVIVDDELVFLPQAATSKASDGAAMVRASAVVATCIALFDELWASASPLQISDGEVRMDTGTRDVAMLLMAGLKDEAIARQLDVSVRTVRRRVGELMNSMGARTRTQLGAVLARRYPATDGAPPGR